MLTSSTLADDPTPSISTAQAAPIPSTSYFETAGPSSNFAYDSPATPLEGAGAGGGLESGSSSTLWGQMDALRGSTDLEKLNSGGTRATSAGAVKVEQEDQQQVPQGVEVRSLHVFVKTGADFPRFSSAPPAKPAEGRQETRSRAVFR
jgi:hypothetical protein